MEFTPSALVDQFRSLKVKDRPTYREDYGDESSDSGYPEDLVDQFGNFNFQERSSRETLDPGFPEDYEENFDYNEYRSKLSFFKEDRDYRALNSFQDYEIPGFVVEGKEMFYRNLYDRRGYFEYENTDMLLFGESPYFYAIDIEECEQIYQDLGQETITTANLFGMTPLAQACFNDNFAVAMWFANHSPKPVTNFDNQVEGDSNFRYPAFECIVNGNIDLFNSLFDAGYPVWLDTFVMAVVYGDERGIATFRELLGRALNMELFQINDEDRLGATLLGNAVYGSSIRKLNYVRLLVDDFGANVNYIDSDGKSILFYAVSDSDSLDPIIDFLLDRGAVVTTFEIESVCKSSIHCDRRKNQELVMILEKARDNMVNDMINRYGLENLEAYFRTSFMEDFMQAPSQIRERYKNIPDIEKVMRFGNFDRFG